MRMIVLSLLLIGPLLAAAQNTIYSYAVANWKDGPVVYITPLIETTEAFTTPQLLEKYKADHPQIREAKDIDVLRFATMEEGEENRQTLKRKYGMRKLEVVMLDEKPAPRTVPSQERGQ